MQVELSPFRQWTRFANDFVAFAHAHQEPPAAANNGGAWTTWLMLGGRGAGKTRAGAEWVRAQVLGLSPYAAACARSIALVGETEHDVREVMIEGPSGIRNISPPGERPQFVSSRRRLEWPNGAVAYAFSAEDPEQLRGPQFDAAWCDELAKWKHADLTFDMLQFGLRLGQRPRQLVTTTPRPIALIKRLVNDPRTAVTRAPTQANAAHLSPAFLDEILARYAGTRLGRQEIDGEIIEDRPDALWTRDMIEAARVSGATPKELNLQRVVIGVDPPGSARRVRMPAASSPPVSPKTASSMCWRMRARQGCSPPVGRRRRSRCTGGMTPTPSLPRSTRAATWCVACCNRWTG